MALTLVVWPVMLLMVSGVYVTGESVRQKIILQNAADAAASAGAVVQADTLSRIAVLNRMMAWTYIQANKMEMDCVVDDWLGRTQQKFSEIRTECIAKNAASACTCPLRIKHTTERDADPVNYGWYTGVVADGRYLRDAVSLNGGSHTPGLEAVKSARTGFSADASDAYENIRTMNDAIAGLKNNAKTRIENAVNRTFTANLTEFGGECTFVASVNSMTAYTGIMTDEKAFLAMSGDDDLSSTPGFDTWWVQGNAPGSGFLRKYQQSGNTLSARIDYHWKRWVSIFDICVPVPPDFAPQQETVNGKDIAASNRTAALPLSLSAGYLSAGTIYAGVKMPMKNPLALIFGQNGTLAGSWYDAYTVADTDMWCVSAARACAYDGEKSAYSRSLYNRNTADWDAVPLVCSEAEIENIRLLLNPAGWNL